MALIKSGSIAPFIRIRYAHTDAHAQAPAQHRKQESASSKIDYTPKKLVSRVFSAGRYEGAVRIDRAETEKHAKDQEI